MPGKTTFAQEVERWDLLESRGFFATEDGYPTDTHYNSKDTDEDWDSVYVDICRLEHKQVVVKEEKGNRNNKAKSRNAMRNWAGIGRTADRVWKVPRSRPEKKVKKQSTQLEMAAKLSSLRSFVDDFAEYFSKVTGIQDAVVLPKLFSNTTSLQVLQEYDNETYQNLVHLTYLLKGTKAPAKKKAVDGLIKDFGLMTLDEFTEKYGQVIEDSNNFGSFGLIPWHVLFVLEYSNAPIPEEQERYPSVGVVLEMIEEKVNNDYALLSSVTLDQGHKHRDIMQEYFDTNNFHNIVVPYKEKMNSRPDNHNREYHKVVKNVCKSRNCNCKAHCKALRKNQVEGSLTCPRLHPTTTQSDHFTAEGVRLKAQDLSKTGDKVGWRRNNNVWKHEPHLQQLCPMYHAAKDLGEKARLIGCDNDALKEAEGQSCYLISIVDDNVDLGAVSGIVMGEGYSRRQLTHYEVAVNRREGQACLYSEYPFEKFAPSAVHGHHEFEESKVWLILPSSIIIQGPDGEDVEVSIPFDLILDTTKRGSMSEIINKAKSLKSYVDLSARESSVTNDILNLDHEQYHYLQSNPKLQQQLGVTFSPKVTVNEGEKEVSYVVLHLQELPTTNDLFTRCISNKEDVTSFEGVKHAPGKADIYSAGFGLQSLIDSARAGLTVITDKGVSTCLLDFCDASIVSNLFCISKDVNKSVLEYTKNTSRNLSIKKSPTEEEEEEDDDDDTSDEAAPPKQKKQKQESEDTPVEPMDEDHTLNNPPIVAQNAPVVEPSSKPPTKAPAKSKNRNYFFLDKVRAIANREGGWVVNGGWDAVVQLLNWKNWDAARCKIEFASLKTTVPGIVNSKLTEEQVNVVSVA